MKMEHEMQHSGKLPLLAYAPQNFGALARQAGGQSAGQGFGRRSKAYRARAAMGRAGTPLLSSPVETQALVNNQAVNHSELQDDVSEQRETSVGLFSRLKHWVSRYLSRGGSSESRQQSVVAPKSNSVDFSTVKNRVDQDKPQNDLLQTHFKSPSSGVDKARSNLVKQSSETINPVSQAYASMRLDPDHEQAIPKATDLAHALAEVRQALRTQEQQILAAQARQSEDHK